MDVDRALAEAKVLRLFPLPGVVHFPNAALPLHIFEARYRQMTEDALATDRLVTMVLLRPEAEWKGKGSPRYEEYACVGKILKAERLPDGRFNLLLLGLRRVRLTREVPSGKMYRASEFELVEDSVVDDAAAEEQKRELIEQFRAFLEPYGGVDANLDEIISSPMTPGALADILAHALPLPIEMKQDLLAEPQVELRLDALCDWLRVASQATGDGPRPTEFPPPFSVN